MSGGRPSHELPGGLWRLSAHLLTRHGLTRLAGRWGCIPGEREGGREGGRREGGREGGREGESKMWEENKEGEGEREKKREKGRKGRVRECKHQHTILPSCTESKLSL